MSFMTFKNFTWTPSSQQQNAISARAVGNDDDACGDSPPTQEKKDFVGGGERGRDGIEAADIDNKTLPSRDKGGSCGDDVEEDRIW